MKDEPREPLSVISEASGLAGYFHIFAALGWGTVAGSVSLIAGTHAFADGGALPSNIVDAIVFLGFFVGLFNLAGLIVIGLPTTFVLRAIDKEYALLYATLGLITGFLVFAIPLEIHRLPFPDALLMPLSAAFAGLASAWRWGSWRERCAEARQLTSQQQASEKRDNPIHDLTH